tara:strand:- start:725 stop:931 length:207 start_codon:yes stop_codon:yes gene_type:complete
MRRIQSTPEHINKQDNTDEKKNMKRSFSVNNMQETSHEQTLIRPPSCQNISERKLIAKNISEEDCEEF